MTLDFIKKLRRYSGNLRSNFYAIISSLIRTLTVGYGITPYHTEKIQLADCTAGRESHPTPKIILYCVALQQQYIITITKLCQESKRNLFSISHHKIQSDSINRVRAEPAHNYSLFVILYSLFSYNRVRVSRPLKAFPLRGRWAFRLPKSRKGRMRCQPFRLLDIRHKTGNFSTSSVTCGDTFPSRGRLRVSYNSYFLLKIL